MLDPTPFIKQNDDLALNLWTRNFREHALLNFEKRIDFSSPTLETKQYLNVTFASFVPSQYYEELAMNCEPIRSWTK
jgi:hypothetical protein